MNNLTNKLGQFLNGLTPRTTAPALGERELCVMKILWESKPLSAKEVLQRIPDCDLSLSTMQSTLERLHRKKLVDREKVERFFVYNTRVSRAEIISLLLGDITEQICDGDMRSLVSGFTNFYSENASGPNLGELGELDKLNKLGDLMSHSDFNDHEASH